MKSFTNTIKRLFFGEAFEASELADFDPLFYGTYYADLHHLKSANDLQRHYVRYGLREGRWKNPTEAKSSLISRFGPLPDDFQTVAYKQTNRDLDRAFDHEWQYEFHYLERGRKEGRNYKLEGEGHWKSFFRLPDFVASAHGWIEEIPQTKEEGMALFLESGIGRLTPINLDLIFDPEFYRSAYGFEDEATGATLYRHWLEIGLPRGLSPNEEKALMSLLSSPRYPEAFDWRRYKLALPRGVGNTLRHRVDVLLHLFKTGFEKGLTKHIDGDGSDELFAEIGDFHLTGGRPHIASAAYDRALALNPQCPGAQHRRGDAHAALGKTVAAHYDFVAAIRQPHASIWSTVHAARTAVANGSFEKSFQILRDGRGKWEKSTDYRATVTEIIEQFFAAKSKSAMSLYDAGDRDVADAYMLKALEELRDRIVELETLPCEIAPCPNGHVSILANQDLAQCKHYRVEQKLRQLREAGIKTEVFNQHDPIPFIRSLLGARAAIFYRVPAFPNIIKALLTAKSLGIPTHYEIDDLIFDAAHYPDTFESYEGQISRSEYNGLCYGVPLFRFAMRLCDYGIASTPMLAGQIEPLVRKQSCLVVRNGLDGRNHKAIDMGRTSRPQRDVVTIFYGSGTKAHNSDFNDLAAPALLSALERYDNVRLVIVGHLRLRCEFDRFSLRVQQLGFVNDLDQYWSLLAASDINLAVLSPGLMSSCKSEIKWLEAAVLQVPSIVSATQTYIEVLEDGVDALIVDNYASAWTSALNRLIEDPDLRRSMGASAQRKALQNYSIEHAAGLLRKRFAAPFAAIGDDKKYRLKIRVLVCSVFFPPQSYGGATRVVQDNVDYFKDECPDIELSVFTTDEGVSRAGQFRFDQYRGIPVFRLSTSIEPNMDWRPFNAEHENIFEQIVDAVQPDVVHFHCIQRLTASIVEIAFRRKIPYFITVHDGWWISDHQFLIDQNDVLRLPSSNYFDAAPPSGVSLIESISRRQRLAGLLEGATRVISVSDSFAEIYRRAGCRNVVAIPNGVSDLKRAPRTNSSDGRLSLGHLGGRSAHKGAKLIEAVLRTNDFDHLKLTMIDFAMQPGTRSERLWGSTPVVLCGATPQSQIADLYASLDVLLAPSIWPESFGLVAREARAQGLWVVASDRGAVGESVKPGENGFIIDVSDGKGLTAVLRKLDANIACYQVPPPQSQEPMRTAADQGREIAGLYRKIWLGSAASLQLIPVPQLIESPD